MKWFPVAFLANGVFIKEPSIRNGVVMFPQRIELWYEVVSGLKISRTFSLNAIKTNCFAF